MRSNVEIYNKDGVIVLVSSARVESNGRTFIYSTIKPYSEGGNAQTCIQALKFALDETRKKEPQNVVMLRFLLSDVSSQAHIIKETFADETNTAISIVGQPPLCDEKVVAVAWSEIGTSVKRIDENTICVSGNTSNSEQEYITTQVTTPLRDSFAETKVQLEKYEEMLTKDGMQISENCIRTWFFVRDIDRNYSGVVDARRENFHANNLTPETHYIASTGIQGNDADTDVTSIFDAFAIKDIPQDKIRILYASDKMNKTIEYGVTFERGVAVDRAEGVRQVFISGTASIDNKGNVLHIGDIDKQVNRMLENIEALLVEAEMNWDDVAQATVYVRDYADAKRVEKTIQEKVSQIVVVLAPVCRPTWLVEMEAVAIKKL